MEGPWRNAHGGPSEGVGEAEDVGVGGRAGGRAGGRDGGEIGRVRSSDGVISD